jgi:radical SAM superfamily enzyme YgiQ (UPF0313 family)
MIRVNNIDVVLTGGASIYYPEIKKILNTAKDVKPNIVTVVGGVIVTADPVTAMEAFENADYGIIGEGEITVNAIAYALETKSDPLDVDGVIGKRNGEWISNDNWPLIPNLEMLPYPDFPGLEYSALFGRESSKESAALRLVDAPNFANLDLSRSCPYRCTFCFHSCGSKFRKKSLDFIFKQIDWLLTLCPVDTLLFDDELSFSDAEYTLEFCRRIKPYGLSWRCSVRADGLTEEVLTAIMESGGVYIFIGLESGDDRILKSMRKNITVAQSTKVLDICVKNGYPIKSLLIVGDEEETTETFWTTVNWWRRYRALDIDIILLRAYPGTEIYKNACKKGIIKDPVQFLKDGCPPVNFSKMTDDEYYALPVLLDIIRAKNTLTDVLAEPLKDYTVNVTGLCPCCGKHVGFPHYRFIFNHNTETCPVCGSNVVLNPIEHCDFDKLNKNLQPLLTGNGLAVWAVNANNFHWLLTSMPGLKADNAVFINRREIVIPHNGKVVKTLGGKQVFQPDIINERGIDTVLVPNNPEAFNEIRALCGKNYPFVKKIIHLSEWM